MDGLRFIMPRIRTTKTSSNCSFSEEDRNLHVRPTHLHTSQPYTHATRRWRRYLMCCVLMYFSFLLFCLSMCVGELDAGGNTPLASALAQCAASGEAIVPEVEALLLAAEEKVRARNAR